MSWKWCELLRFSSYSSIQSLQTYLLSFIPQFNLFQSVCCHLYLPPTAVLHWIFKMSFFFIALLLIFSTPFFESFPPVHFLRFQLWCVILYGFLWSGNPQGGKPPSWRPCMFKHILPTNPLPILLSLLLYLFWSFFCPFSDLFSSNWKLVENVSTKGIPAGWVNYIPLLPHNQVASIPQLSWVNNYCKGNVVLRS